MICVHSCQVLLTFGAFVKLLDVGLQERRSNGLGSSLHLFEPMSFP